MHFQTPLKVMLVLVIATNMFCASEAFAAELDLVGAGEIEQLLTRLAVSGCRFQRNGSWYEAPQAREHLDKKYRYLLEQQLIGSAEDFVAGGATKSSMSGKPYLVQCGTQAPVPSAAWMALQLREVRAAVKSGRPPKTR